MAELDIIFERLSHQTGDLGVIKLNRLGSLNALTHDMITSMFNQLMEWRVDNSIKAVVIKSLHEKAFCAGGDVRAIYDKHQAGDTELTQFFYDEYRLNFLIHHYPKPYIALINGVTMGGGVGISLHGSHRIAVGDVMLAMPETSLGLFPDVGGGYLLSRCPDFFGMYLALTGERFNAADAMYLELIDRVIATEDEPKLIAALLEADMKNEASTVVSHIQRSFSVDTPPSQLCSKEALVESCFSHDSLESILAALEKSQIEEADKLHAELLKKSPMSLQITFEQMRQATMLSLSQDLKMEYRLVNRFVRDHDFFEGVRALLVDKDKQPHWQPNTVTDVSKEAVQAYFEPIDEELKLEDLR